MSDALYPSRLKGLLPQQILKTSEFRTLEQTSPNGYTLALPQTVNPLWHFTLTYDYLYDTHRSPNNTQAYAPYSDFATLLGFVLARGGKADDFLFADPEDQTADSRRSGVWQGGTAYVLGQVIIDRVGHAQLVTSAGTSGLSWPAFSSTGGAITEGSVTWTDQGFAPQGLALPVALPLVTDGLGAWYSPIQRSVGGLFQEDITDLQPGTLQVWSNGTPIVNGSPFAYQVKGPGLALPGVSYRGLYLQWASQPTAPVTANFQFYFRVQFEEDTQDFERWLRGLYTIGGQNGKNGSGYVKLKSARRPLV